MLSLLIFFPSLFLLVLSLVPQRFLNLVALIGSLMQSALSVSLFFLYDPSRPELQLVQNFSLLPYFGIDYFLALDGLSFWYIQLSSFLLPLVILSSWKKQNPWYFFFLFALVSLSNGAFLSFDALLFYIFFESSLIPLFFMIGLWGGKERFYAAFKFFIYTAFGSLFLLAGIVALMNLVYYSTGGGMSASFLDFYKLDIPFVKDSFFNSQNILFLCFFLAFAIKLPFVPFHTWLPLAHVEAPAPGSAWLAAVILKMGAYGFFRILLPIFPDSVNFFAPLLSLLAGLGIVYGAFMALAQINMKKLVAYSSVSHMAYVLLGLFSLNFYGISGAFYQMLTHAISSAALFLLVGMIYERTHNLNISDYGGLAQKMPRLAIFFVIISLSAMALPSTGGFISEFLVLLGVFKAGHWLALAFAVTGLVFGATYMLYLIHRVFFGNMSEISQTVSKLSKRETWIIIPFILLVFIMGVFPKMIFKYSNTSLKYLYDQRLDYELTFKEKGTKHNE